VIGAAVAAAAIVSGAFPLFLSGTLLMGVAHATLQFDRFAAAEVNPPQRRGQAIAIVVFGGTVGSIVGPLLVGPSGMWAARIGVNELAGPYTAGLVVFGLACLTLFVGLRPDPRDIGKKIAALYPDGMVHHGPARKPWHIFRTPGGVVAVSAMVIGQLVMVLIMGITSLHMKDNQHTLTDISLVFSAHTFGMFAFSIVSGRLADRWGRAPVILTGTGILISACVIAQLSAQVYPLAFALFLLGLGWNLSYVGGTSLLVDQLIPAERARTQGANELLVGLARASANIGGGLLYAVTSYSWIATIGGVLSLVLLALTIWWLGRTRRAIKPEMKSGGVPEQADFS
jgi:predicted MFS family arabinose efflux permease